MDEPGDLIFEGTGIAKDAQFKVTNNGSFYRVYRSTNFPTNATKSARSWNISTQRRYPKYLRWEAGKSFYSGGATPSGQRLLFPIPSNVTAGLNDQGRQLLTNAVESLVPQLDGTPPALVLNGVSPTTVMKDSVFTDPGATAIDETDGDLTNSIVVTGTVDTSTIGDYTLTYTVSDLSTNESVISRLVKVVDGTDTTPPVITLLGDETITIEAGTPFNDPGVRAGDDGDGDLSDIVFLDNSLPKSGLVLHLNAADLEGLSDGDQLSTWTDGSSNGLVFNASSTAPKFKESGLRSQPAVTFTGTEAMIHNGTAGLVGQPSVTTIFVAKSNNESGRRFFKLGATSARGGEVFVLAQDASFRYNNGNKVWNNDGFQGNEPTLAVFQVDLSNGYEDGRYWLNGIEAESTAESTSSGPANLPPSGFEIIVGTDRQGSGALHPGFQGDIHEVLVFDRILSGGELNAWGANLQFKYGVEGTYAPFDSTMPGSYALTYRVSDSSGNSAEATRTVKVIDTTPPSITLTGGSIQVVGVGSFFTDPGFSAEDASDGIITDKVNVIGNTIDTSKPGIHEIEYLVADSAGNAAPRTIRTVVVQHTEIPVHAYWKFDETAGTTAQDSSGNEIHGTLKNYSGFNSWVEGKVGNALNFDGVSDFVEIPAGLTVPSELTLSMWIRREGSIENRRRIFFWSKASDQEGSNGFIAGINDPGNAGQAAWFVTTRDNSSSNRNFYNAYEGDFNALYPEGVWTHIAFTYSSKDKLFSVFKDGENVVSQPGSGILRDFDATSAIGVQYDRNRNFFMGGMDEAAIIGTVLSEEQISWIADGGDPRATPNDLTPPVLTLRGENPLLHEKGVPFEDPGATANDNIGSSVTRQGDLQGWWSFDGRNANDLSGNNYHGQPSAMDIFSDDTAFGSGQSVNLTGNKFITVSDGGSESTFDGEDFFTLSFWFKGWPDSEWEPFISKRGESNQGWQIRRRGDSQEQIAFTLRGPGNDDWGAASTANHNEWHHCVAVWGSGKRVLYIDGVEIGSDTRSGRVNATGSDLVFGARDNSGNAGNRPSIANHSNVWLDDIRFYRAVLKAEDVSSIFNSGDGDLNIHPGLTAQIEVSGDDVDVSQAGDYTVFYNVDDAAGNSAIPLERVVRVADTTLL